MGCNEEYGGRYTITYLIERSCTLTVHSENSKDLFSFPSTNETLRESLETESQYHHHGCAIV